MPIRDDVVRGVRAGSILLASLLFGFICYRAMQRPAAPRLPARPAAVVPAPAAMPALSPAKIPPIADVPPPPPLGAAVHRLRRHSLQVEVPPVIEPTPVPEQVAPIEDKPVNSPVEERTEIIGLPPEAAVEPAPAPQPEIAEPFRPPDHRPKRWLKAVGHFLHISGKREWQPQAGHPQN